MVDKLNFGEVYPLLNVSSFSVQVHEHWSSSTIMVVSLWTFVYELSSSSLHYSLGAWSDGEHFLQLEASFSSCFLWALSVLQPLMHSGHFVFLGESSEFLELKKPKLRTEKCAASVQLDELSDGPSVSGCLEATIVEQKTSAGCF